MCLTACVALDSSYFPSVVRLRSICNYYNMKLKSHTIGIFSAMLNISRLFCLYLACKSVRKPQLVVAIWKRHVITSSLIGITMCYISITPKTTLHFFTSWDFISLDEWDVLISDRLTAFSATARDYILIWSVKSESNTSITSAYLTSTADVI